MSEHLPRTNNPSEGEQIPLNDDQWMLLMAWADGELQDDAEATKRVQALLERSVEARTLVHDLSISAGSMRRELLGEIALETSANATTEPPLDDALEIALQEMQAEVKTETEAMAIMAWTDGERADDETAQAELQALLTRSEGARNLAHDLKLSQRALREEILNTEGLSREMKVDLSMMRAQVLDRLPMPARQDATVRRLSLGEELMRWLRSALLGRGGMGFGLAAAALLLAVALSQVQDKVATQPGPDEVPSVAQLPETNPALDGEPAVIIEEMEIDSGTVLVDRGEGEDEPTIIWHFQDDEEEAG